MCTSTVHIACYCMTGWCALDLQPRWWTWSLSETAGCVRKVIHLTIIHEGVDFLSCLVSGGLDQLKCWSTEALFFSWFFSGMKSLSKINFCSGKSRMVLISIVWMTTLQSILGCRTLWVMRKPHLKQHKGFFTIFCHERSAIIFKTMLATQIFTILQLAVLKTRTIHLI